jgi:hypothetical protein
MGIPCVWIMWPEMDRVIFASILRNEPRNSFLRFLSWVSAAVFVMRCIWNRFMRCRRKPKLISSKWKVAEINITNCRDYNPLVPGPCFSCSNWTFCGVYVDHVLLHSPLDGRRLQVPCAQNPINICFCCGSKCQFCGFSWIFARKSYSFMLTSVLKNVSTMQGFIHEKRNDETFWSFSLCSWVSLSVNWIFFFFFQI